MKWFRKAAEQGNPLAQRNLAVMYENGLGVTDGVKAATPVEWYKKAAERGRVLARGNQSPNIGPK